MLANRDIIPGIKNGTLLGVFLGDELCCEDTSARSGMECWDTVLRPVADAILTEVDRSLAEALGEGRQLNLL